MVWEGSFGKRKKFRDGGVWPHTFSYQLRAESEAGEEGVSWIYVSKPSTAPTKAFSCKLSPAVRSTVPGTCSESHRVTDAEHGESCLAGT
jgi:hypothetical protein